MRWVLNAPPQSLYPREKDPEPFLQEAGWAPLVKKDGGEHELDSIRNNKSLSRCDVVFSFVTSLMSHLCTARTTHNTPEYKCINSHAQHTTELQTNVFLTTTHQSLATNRERSAFPSAKKNIQGQLQAP
jgi:hypothetical protein